MKYGLLHHLHRFRDLPRELQLQIWKHSELSMPHRRHYFCRMLVWRGLLYAGSDQGTSRSVNNLAIAGDRDEIEVPDPAVTPNMKLKYDGTTCWISRSPPPAAASFGKVQLPKRLPNPASAGIPLGEFQERHVLLCPRTTEQVAQEIFCSTSAGRTAWLGRN